MELSNEDLRVVGLRSSEANKRETQMQELQTKIRVKNRKVKDSCSEPQGYNLALERSRLRCRPYYKNIRDRLFYKAV